MIVGNLAIAPTMSGVGQTAKATIKASARLFSFFSDMVYADKFVAIWRELVANGMDSHKSVKSLAPVSVTLPTTFTPFAKVRDFGTGMDRDFLMGKFMAFAGDSEKQLSDDMIGGFSIGSKAPLSYTEQFAIHSFQDGVVRVYSLFKDEEGCPAIAFLSESKTHEPNGIEISFPVEQKDITAFRDAAFKSLKYFTPLPVLKNSTDQLVGPEYTVKSDTWGFRKESNTSQVVMGGVAYPIDKDSVARTNHDILDFGIDFQVPIGTVGVALSREALSYTEGTIAAIGALCDGIRPKIQDHVNAMFESQPTKWEAVTAYNKAVRGNSYSASTRLVETLAHYKGEKLQRYIDPVMADKVWVSFVTEQRYTKNGRHSWSTSRASPPFGAWLSAVCPTDIQHILIDDSDGKPILRCRAFLESMTNHNEGVMIVRKRPDIKAVVGNATPEFKNDLEWDDFIKALGSPKVTYLSTIEPAVVTRNGTSVSRVEKIRGYNRPHVNGGFVDTLPATGGYYVEMECFSIKGISRDEIAALDKGDKPLYYFNKGDFEKVKKLPQWVSAKSKVDEQLKSYKKTYPNAAIAKAFQDMKNYGYNNSRNRLGARLLELLGNPAFACPKRGPLARLNTLHKSVEAQLTGNHNTMRSLAKVEAGKHAAGLDTLIQEIETAHPELTLLAVNTHSLGNLVSVFNKLV